jgi:beta-lactamase superfamily II metal-dependent hydrolase
MATRKSTKKSSKKSAAKKSRPHKGQAVKKTPRKPTGSAENAATKRRASKTRLAAADKFRAKVRMYRQGLGDCFLITLPRRGTDPYFILIDCGVILGTKDPKIMMTKVVENIINTTGGRLNLVVATHEHWDHISGFLQTRELWEGKTEEDDKKLEVDEVWLAWSEDSADDLAKKLNRDRHGLRLALTGAAAHLRMAGSTGTADEVTSLLEFFGATGSGRTTADALEIIKRLSPNLRFCRPEDAPVIPDGTEVKIYVLGPPHDEKLLKQYKPSTKQPETYGLALAELFMSDIQPALGDPSYGAPFDTASQIPMMVAEQMTFFKTHYWGEDADSDEKDQGWRRIAGSWLDSSSALALQLDSATNNTSLVLAFELGDGDVLLFASDAQVGNWLSWQNLKWEVDGKAVTGPDLLRRTIFYKVGHHGSHNATLRELGLEQMTGLELAFMPVDHEMAVKKRWGKIPLTELLNRLNKVTKSRVVRIDESLPPQLEDIVTSDPLFYEVVL